MKKTLLIISVFITVLAARSQTPSFKTYMNPVIPGDHPDCTVTQVGKDFYTTGSSFNITPVIYHSTDLVHWEAIAQPVSASWAKYDDKPGAGCWGGQVVYFKGKWWDYFSRAVTMYFVTADKPEGPWSEPTKVIDPSTLPYGLGYDNSIFIDDDNKWYLVVKNGQPNGGIVELGDNGQATGVVYDLKWLNPSPALPYSWAEGPVMWKYDGYYYYSFARDLAGGQKVMRSKTLTAEQSICIFTVMPTHLFSQNVLLISLELPGVLSFKVLLFWIIFIITIGHYMPGLNLETMIIKQRWIRLNLRLHALQLAEQWRFGSIRLLPELKLPNAKSILPEA